MNTLVYAYTTDQETSAASTMQHMSVSFGVATTGQASALFVPGNRQAGPSEMIRGIHKPLIALGH